MMFKSSDIMVATQGDYLGIKATAECGCNMSNAVCGANNFESTGTQTTSQCGANHTAEGNPNYKNNNNNS